MPTLRLCTHIKTNGIKCGSPALRHHTLCYFHYQWQRRDQRRIRLGGPVGMNKNTGIELPLLDGPEAILVSIMEIQRGLLDHRIEIKMGTALLYSLQLALQAKIPYSGLCAREPVRECPELDMDLEMERARAMRPAKEKCAACPKQDDCLSPRNCRKLPKLPKGYRREGDRLVRDNPEVGGTVPDLTTDSSSRAESLTTDSSSRAKVAIRCSGAAVGALATAVEGPTSSPTEATTLETTPIPETSPALLRESSPGREPGEVVQGPASRSSDPPIVRSSDLPMPLNWELRTKPTENPHANCILGSNPHALIDLPRKFPQLIETTQPQI